MEYRDGRILRAEHYYGLAFNMDPANESVKSMVEQIKEELEALRVHGTSAEENGCTASFQPQSEGVPAHLDFG